MRLAKKITVAYVACLILLAGLMVAVYSIPKERVEANAWKGVSQLYQEGFYPAIMGCHLWILDNATDLVMLKEAVNLRDDNPLHDSMLNEFPGFYDDNGYIYGRYWHGYLVTLRPLLTFMSYNQIRGLTMALLLLLLCWASTGVFRRCGRAYGICFSAVMIVMIVPPVLISMQYATCFIITLTAVGLMTSIRKIVSSNDNFYVFMFIVGILTVYFDFLTAPVVTLCFPLVIYMATAKSHNSILTVVGSSLWWALGYGIFWATKWVLATSITGYDFFNDAQNSVALRTGGLYILTYSKYIIIGCYSLLFAGILAIWRLRAKMPNAFRYIYLLLIALIPGVWFLVLREHSFHHFWYTYRAASGSLFATLIYIVKLNASHNRHPHSLPQ